MADWRPIRNRVWHKIRTLVPPEVAVAMLDQLPDLEQPETNNLPFDLIRALPEELLELIVNLLEPEDIFSFFNLYPLHVAPNPDEVSQIQRRKRLWYFRLILPIMFNWKGTSYLTMEEVKTLRLVSLMHRNEVDRHLNRQPQLNVASTSTLRSVPFPLLWHPAIHHEFDVISSSPQDLGYKNYWGGVAFRRVVDDLNRFLREFRIQPATINPFISSAVSINFLADRADPQGRRFAVAIERGMVQTMSILELCTRYGMHIKHFSLSASFNYFNPKQFFQILLLLPNLKSLTLADAECPEINPDNMFHIVVCCGNVLPKLQYLESMNTVRCCRDMSCLLSRAYGKQLRRLWTEYFNWNGECLSDSFPHLEELVITIGVGFTPSRRLNPNTGVLLLKMITSSNYSTLTMIKLVSSTNKFPTHGFDMSIEMFMSAMSKFSFLRYLDIGLNFPHVKFYHAVPPRALRIKFLVGENLLPCLEFLAIRDSIGLTYDFLKCCVALKTLQIVQTSLPCVTDLSHVNDISIREEMQTGKMYKSTVWEYLPSLQNVDILSTLYFGGRERLYQYHFTRSGYERHLREPLSVPPTVMRRNGVRPNLNMYHADIVNTIKQAKAAGKRLEMNVLRIDGSPVTIVLHTNGKMKQYMIRVDLDELREEIGLFLKYN